MRRPTEEPELSEVVKIAAGQWSTCALRRDGTVWCWGQNEALPDGLGVLGDGLPPSERCVPFEVVDGGRVEHPSAAMFCHKRPTQVPGITDAIDVSMGFNHACVVRATGQVLCWGANDGGQLGDGTTVSRGVARPVRWY